MPLSAMVTPLSLYMLDDTIFNGIQLPTPPTNPTDYPDLYVQGFQLDRQILIDNLLMETGEMNVIYPDPEFFKYAVTSWSRKELPVWQELYNTLFYKYNPLWNKDGTIKETARELRDLERGESRTRSRTEHEEIADTIREEDGRDLNVVTSDTRVNSGTVQDAGQSSENTTHGGAVTTANSDTTETKVAAFDSSTYQKRDFTESSGTETVTDASTVAVTGTNGNTRTDNLRQEDDGSSTETGTLTHEGDNTRERDGTDSETETVTGTDEGTVDNTLTRTETGNIGVTMTSALIQAQRDLVKLNFYDLIIESFKERFCILVY